MTTNNLKRRRSIMERSLENNMKESSEKKKKISYGEVLKRLFADMGKNRLRLLAALVIIAAAKICLAFAPAITQRLVDYLKGTVAGGSFDMGFICINCLILAVLYFFGNGADGFVNVHMVRISQGLARSYRNRIEKKLNAVPINYMDTHATGDILSRATVDILNMTNGLESTAATLIGQGVLLIGIIVMMLVTEWRLALIYFVALPVNLAVVAAISKGTGKQFRQMNEALGELTAEVTDTYSNHMVVKSYTCEKEKSRNFQDLNQNFFKCYVKSRFLSGFMIPISNIMNNLSYIALCAIGGFLMIRGGLTIGEFTAFLFYGNMIGSPLSQLSSSMNNIQTALTSAGRIFELLDEKEEPVEEPSAVLDQNAVRGKVEFDHVQFGYLKEKQLMEDVSFTVEPGMTVAIVGPSGAGKTTLINLLMRFYDIWSGHIYIDGTDAYNLSKENLRSVFGMVLQDTWIFDGTVGENISYGKIDATEEEIQTAAKMVQCDSFIGKLADGYDTHLSDESSALSAGEKQLLAISRAVIANPKILILDEATSQVDTRTEAMITRAMEKMMEGRTTFIIVHRLYTIQNADKIIFMVDGDIKEVGSHEELMQKGGYYANMYRSAAEN